MRFFDMFWWCEPCAPRQQSIDDLAEYPCTHLKIDNVKITEHTNKSMYHYIQVYTYYFTLLLWICGYLMRQLLSYANSLIVWTHISKIYLYILCFAPILFKPKNMMHTCVVWAASPTNGTQTSDMNAVSSIYQEPKTPKQTENGHLNIALLYELPSWVTILILMMKDAYKSI